MACIGYRKDKIFVGMSGGVDSSLAAALLIEQGYDVNGVYMKNWTTDLPGMKCPWAEDLADAKRVAVQLGIPFKVFDFQKEYKSLVVDYMIAEYQAGRTPNPDIMCNQEVKFKLFLDAALADGADMIATGHYARTKGGKLLCAVDTDKDQTYFLYRVTEAALEKTLFPLGDFTSKKEVRCEAEKRGLATARKKDSQGICFVGSVGIRDFLSEFVETASGNIIDHDTDKIIGQHDGAIFYTFGQRHGLSVGGGLPYYVVGKDMAKNEVYVSTNLNADGFWSKEIELIDVHWINEPYDFAGSEPAKKKYQVRVRHRAPLIGATITGSDPANKRLTIKLATLERAIAPGQSVVIYNGEIVLGGGIIRSK